MSPFVQSMLRWLGLVRPDSGGSIGRLFKGEPPYGPPIRDAVASGDLNQMRRVRHTTSEWLSSIEVELTAIRQELAKLDAAIANLEA
jgi:Domain of unknown function (DUF1843)